MKKYLITILGFLLSNVSNAQLDDFEQAKKMAVATNKIIVVDFWATWCGPCKKMDVDVWSNTEVLKVMDDFIFVKIDIDRNRELATKYGVNSIPNIFILDSFGKKLESNNGYMSQRETLSFLDSYRLSTEFFSKEAIEYFKKPGFNTSINLATKMLDYSLYLEKPQAQKFVYNAIDYLKDAKKELNKKETDYEDKLKKIQLLELYEYVYNFNFEKLNKKLENFEGVEFADFLNKNHYYFLKYLSNFEENKTEEKQKIFNDLEGFSYFKAKADSIYNLYLEKNKS